MAYVMQGLDFCLSFNQARMVLGRHRGREGKVECSICGAECECGSCVVGVSSKLM